MLLSKLNALILYVTHDCNLSCSYCLNQYHTLDHADFNPADIPKLKAFVDGAASGKNFFLVFFGGEPFLRWENCRRIMEGIPGINYLVQTNGTCPPPTLLEDIRDHDLFVSVSFDPRRERHNEQRGRWDDTRAFLRRGVEEFPDRLGVTHTFYPVRADELAEDILALFGMGIKSVRATAIKEGHYSNDYYKAIIDSYYTIAEYLFDHPDLIYGNLIRRPLLDREALQADYELFMKGISSSFCRAGVAKAWVNVNGDVYPCSSLIAPQFKLGNLFTGEENVSLIRRIEQPLTGKDCLQCPSRAGCYPCLHLSQSRHGTLFYCDHIIRDDAASKQRFLGWFYSECIKRGFLDERGSL
jgi:radical SAM protein with 4Fe4S-binding SPASM domain